MASTRCSAVTGPGSTCVRRSTDNRTRAGCHRTCNATILHQMHVTRNPSHRSGGCGRAVVSDVGDLPSGRICFRIRKTLKNQSYDASRSRRSRKILTDKSAHPHRAVEFCGSKRHAVRAQRRHEARREWLKPRSTDRCSGDDPSTPGTLVIGEWKMRRAPYGTSTALRLSPAEPLDLWTSPRSSRREDGKISLAAR